MDYRYGNETENMTSAIENNSADDSKGNMTNTEHIQLPNEWYFFVESIIVGACALTGLIGNVAVIRGALKTKRSSKQNVFLLIGLALGDYFVCLIRGPSLIYIIFRSENSPDVICELWMTSTIFLIIAVIMNMVIAIERKMIMYDFQQYLRTFTPRRVLSVSIFIWLSVIGCFLAVYKGLAFRSTLHATERSCYLATNLFDIDDIDSATFRVCAVTIFGVLPITVQAFCYISLVVKVYKAGLIKMEKIDEHITYTRITGNAIARVLVTVLCLFPVLICFSIGPMYPEVYYSNVRFLDDLVIFHSAISPLISMHDSDFRETFFKWKRRCSHPFNRRTEGKKRSIRSNGISSADMKTLGYTYNS